MRLFGFCVSIAYNSVSITHNSKYVGPTVENSVWFLFSVFVFITQFSDFWTMSYGNWKHILGVFSFQNSVFNGIFVIKHTLRDPPAATFDSLSFFFLPFFSNFLFYFSILPFVLSFFLFFLPFHLSHLNSFFFSFLFFLPFRLSHLNLFFFPFIFAFLISSP